MKWILTTYMLFIDGTKIKNETAFGEHDWQKMAELIGWILNFGDYLNDRENFDSFIKDAVNLQDDIVIPQAVYGPQEKAPMWKHRMYITEIKDGEEIK